MTNDEIETIDVPREGFLHFVYELVMESDDHQIHLNSDETEEFYNNICPQEVENVEILDDETVVIHATTYTHKIVDRIPATRWQPPETIMEEREVMYDIKFTMDGLGILSLHAERA